jgi:hypothetical protein
METSTLSNCVGFVLTIVQNRLILLSLVTFKLLTWVLGFWNIVCLMFIEYYLFKRRKARTEWRHESTLGGPEPLLVDRIFWIFPEQICGVCSHSIPWVGNVEVHMQRCKCFILTSPRRWLYGWTDIICSERETWWSMVKRLLDHILESPNSLMRYWNGFRGFRIRSYKLNSFWPEETCTSTWESCGKAIPTAYFLPLIFLASIFPLIFNFLL